MFTCHLLYSIQNCYLKVFSAFSNNVDNINEEKIREANRINTQHKPI